MKMENLKLVTLVVFIMAALCFGSYVGKSKETRISPPTAVKKTIKALYPQRWVENVRVRQEGLKAYEIELEQEGQEFKVTVAPDGTVMKLETEVSAREFPEVVITAINQVGKGAKVTRGFRKEIIYAVAKLVKLDESQTIYKIRIIKNDEEREIKISTDGRVLENIPIPMVIR